MEKNKKAHVLVLLLALLCVCAEQTKGCPNVSDVALRDLSCDSDYNRTITCLWNSSSVSELPDSVCTLYTKMSRYSSSCELKPVDASRPTLRMCSLTFKRPYNFLTYHNLTLNLSCKPGKQTLIFFYMPASRIKLNPPPQPHINFTTASWFPQVTKHLRISHYCCELQWKHQDQPWSSIQKRNIRFTDCTWDCRVELNHDWLIQGERYEARIRVMTTDTDTKSIWSDWSPTASWVSPTGRTKQLQSGFTGGGFVAGAAAFAIFLVVLRFKTDKTTWVYMVKRIRGKPIPDPADSFLQNGNFQNWLSPHFTSESFHSPYKLVEIAPVEVTSSVDAVASCRPEAALLEKIRCESSYGSNSSNFSNPSYSQLCPPPPPPPPPPVSSLTAGNLAPCAADTPYGPVGGQAKGENEEQDGDEVRGKEVEIRELLSKGSNNSELMLVISDYEKVEKLQVERARLQSLDSGVCSGEEVSQESLEVDSINVTDEGPEGEEERDAGNGKEAVIQKLFGGSGGVFGKGSMQVCSGYEQVQKLQADSAELPSLESGISSGGEEQVSQEESLEDAEKSTESTSLLIPPPPAGTSPCSLPFLSPQPLNFSGPSLSPALPPQPSHLLERLALMSTNRSVEPSGDGYMSVRQDES